MNSTAAPSACPVLIIGSGPAGLFAADQLVNAGVDNVVIVEKGSAMPARTCHPVRAATAASATSWKAKEGLGLSPTERSPFRRPAAPTAPPSSHRNRHS